MKKYIVIALVALVALACNKPTNYVEVETSMGNFTVELYDETPLHRDNFQFLVKQGFYDEVLFHRVIKDFMVQGGDPDSRDAKADQRLGNGGPGYTIPAELNASERCFHRKGVLAAARKGDQVNPTKASSGSQFYVVVGKTYTENELALMEQQRMMQAKQKIFQQLSQTYADTLAQLRLSDNPQDLKSFQKELTQKMDEQLARDADKFYMSLEQKAAYKEVGGTPHLDGAYTVFGEVVKGLEVVEAISKVKTQPGDRPEQDIKMSMHFVRKP